MRGAAPIAALALAVALAACGNDDSSSRSAGPKTTSTTPKPSSAGPAKPRVRVPDGPVPKKLVADDLRVGSGPAAEVGEEVTVQYVGVKFGDGKQIDASWDRGEPFSFRLGSGTVIPGWEDGVPGMRAGGRRRLVIPSRLAYRSGALVFVIDLVSIGGPAEERAEREPPVEVPDGPPPKELVVEDLEEGSGAEVEPGDDIVVDYVGVNYRTGRTFESTWQGPEPGTFTLGTGEVIEGWEEGLEGMKVGGRRKLVVPSRLAYKTGTLIYVIDLVDIE
jgi:peptidylprolyl isomerase